MAENSSDIELKKLIAQFESSSRDELETFFTDLGKIITLTGHLVHLLCPDDKDFVRTVKEGLDSRMSDSQGGLMYANVNSERGQEILRLFHNTSASLLKDD